MTMLQSASLRRAAEAIDLEAGRMREALRTASYGPDATDTPAGYVRLQSKEDRALWLRHLQLEAKREQDGFAEGQMAQQAASHPAVRAEITKQTLGTGDA